MLSSRRTFGLEKRFVYNMGQRATAIDFGRDLSRSNDFLPRFSEGHDLESKLGLLAGSARFDLCGACGQSASSRQRATLSVERWIYPSALPDGRTVRLLKVLQTNSCTRNCLYCENRVSRDIARESFSPEELSRLFERLQAAGLAEGLFLSSSIERNPDADMARMIATAELVRKRFGFRGYIHLKVLPGASQAAIERAAQVADRISINLEAPGPEALARIARQKNFMKDMLPQVGWIQGAVENPNTRARSHTTQFVVGAAGESDLEILSWTDRLYRKAGLQRAYFSAYQIPDEDASLPGPPTPLLREHRLYQADFLLRRYGFQLDELVFQQEGLLSLDADPKQAWASQHPELFPVDISKAPIELLLRVPGIGPVSARRICTARSKGLSGIPEDLRKLGVVLKRAAPYCLWAGRALAPDCLQEELPFEEVQEGFWGAGPEPAHACRGLGTEWTDLEDRAGERLPPKSFVVDRHANAVLQNIY